MSISDLIPNISIESKIEYLRSEIEHKAIYRVPPSSPSLPGKAPNTKYTWQFYLRRCLFDPKFVFIAADLLVQKLSSRNIQIGACEDAGVTLGMAMSTIIGSPMITIKKTRKSYGLLNFTEGIYIERPILIVDDLAGSQNTIRTAINTLNSFGIKIADQYAAIINKTQSSHSSSYIQDKELISLFTCEDFAMTWTDYCNKYGYRPNFGKYF
jgi:orotate phosphoribosyltransferase